MKTDPASILAPDGWNRPPPSSPSPPRSWACGWGRLPADIRREAARRDESSGTGKSRPVRRAGQKPLSPFRIIGFMLLASGGDCGISSSSSGNTGDARLSGSTIVAGVLDDARPLDALL